MNEELSKYEDESYRLAEQKAISYFRSLTEHVNQNSYIPILTKDINAWKQERIHHPLASFFMKGKRRPNTKDYHQYIQWMDSTGKLDTYLERSISYIFMRDLGKDMNSPIIKKRIRSIVENLKQDLTSTSGKSEMFSMAKLFRMAQKENVESTFIWVMNKMKFVSSHLPDGLDAEQAQRKLIKIIAGVVMQEIEEMDNDVSSTERKKRLEKAIRLGYCYGLTYPFVDDLLDSKVLSNSEKRQYSNLIRTTLLTGTVPRLKWSGDHIELITFIHAELKDAFEYIKANQRDETSTTFFEQSYVFFQSQEVDRNKSLSNPNYSNEEIYIPVILKSASSRLIVRSVISAPKDMGFDNRTFYYGIYNQLADDFADMFDDLENGAVTPYTYYLRYHNQRNDLINPFELYWTVIYNLIHNVYRSDRKVCELILDRAINGLKRFKERTGDEKYKEVMNLFTSEISEFNNLIQHVVRKAENVDFFDKLLRDHILTTLRTDRKEQDDFFDTVKEVRQHVNEILPMTKEKKLTLLEDPIVDAANYSLEGSGKRLRPVISWFMAVKEYELNQTAIEPLLKSLEYLHTASLIFDDLPSQDNSAFRRGRPTLHQVQTVGIAELTGLFLTQRAIWEQASLDKFDAKAVLELIRYSVKMTEDMCKGQELDLASKGKKLTKEQLNKLCFYKTGIAFEATLVMPAILAQVNEEEVQALKTYAYHLGIAFQIKDDLLDVEGDEQKLGKPLGKDMENNRSTFVSVLGIDGARNAMWDHYCSAMEVLQEVPQRTSFLKHLLNYIIHRDH
ncbi:polyprenyl synthetase family protein [Metabacillus malikii]|uniref:Geranylgeranyl pyrophosphate synthase n=1 Tax=Metabacillus malikii TaxID=1504265 RepID=A0ABT9ZDJ9_9BACI|nr:polyprenyl synthetase family protein [Metabacillus malikii]MDQ0230334.1 geranylgeranyl pyrophosphate synthase [Metabacillus malikii]